MLKYGNYSDMKNKNTKCNIDRVICVSFVLYLSLAEYQMQSEEHAV